MIYCLDLKILICFTCLISILSANKRVGETPIALHVLKSGRRTYPVMHPHLKLP